MSNPFMVSDDKRAQFQWQVYAAQQLESDLDGMRLSEVELEVRRDYMMRGLVYTLRGAVVKHEGGATATDRVTVDLAVRPRWFPKWAWRRMPVARATWELQATPEWVYPYSDHKVPFGRPVEAMLQKTVRYEE